MIFAHDTEAALIAVAALVNTAGRDGGLPDLAALDAFSRRTAGPAGASATEAELRAVRALRPRLRRFWELARHEVVDDRERALREAGALPQLVRHDGWAYHLHATPPDAPLATRMAVEAAMAFVDVVRGRAGPAADLRVVRLRQRGRRSDQEPLEAVLRRRLRQPGGRQRVPRPQGAPRSAGDAGRTGRTARPLRLERYRCTEAHAVTRHRAAAVGPLPCLTGGPLCYGAGHGAVVGG